MKRHNTTAYRTLNFAAATGLLFLAVVPTFAEEPTQTQDVDRIATGVSIAATITGIVTAGVLDEQQRQAQRSLPELRSQVALGSVALKPYEADVQKNEAELNQMIAAKGVSQLPNENVIAAAKRLVDDHENIKTSLNSTIVRLKRAAEFQPEKFPGLLSAITAFEQTGDLAPLQAFVKNTGAFYSEYDDLAIWHDYYAGHRASYAKTLETLELDSLMRRVNEVKQAFDGQTAKIAQTVKRIEKLEARGARTTLKMKSLAGGLVAGGVLLGETLMNGKVISTTIEKAQALTRPSNNEFAETDNDTSSLKLD